MDLINATMILNGSPLGSPDGPPDGVEVDVAGVDHLAETFIVEAAQGLVSQDQPLYGGNLKVRWVDPVAGYESVE